MIRYILVDDEPKTLKSVQKKIERLSKEYELQHVNSYESSKRAFEEVNDNDFDLLIVDFEMPVYNGIELAQKIAQNKKVIFLTSTINNEKSVINSLDISGYLSKPFEIETFETILKNKVIGKINTDVKATKNDLITLQIGSNRDVRFKAEQAYYISTSININGEKPDKNCVHIYGKNDVIIAKNVRKTIEELYKELGPFNFKKTNKSTIINMSQIKERDNYNICLHDCKESFKILAKEKKGFVAKIRGIFNNY